MLAQANERKMFVSRLLQLTNGNDVKFTCYLGGIFENVRRMNLNSVCLDNYFLNMQNLDINDGTRTITLVVDQFVTYYTIISWLNQKLSEAGSALVLTLQPPIAWEISYLHITGTVPFSFPNKNSDWYTKLGFQFDLDSLPSNDHKASSPYDFQQSATILIRLNNQSNSITNSVLGTYQFANTQTFGQRIQFQWFNFNSVQNLLFSSPQTISQLEIELLDEFGNQLRTPNNNNCQISVVLNISCYDQ